MIKKHFKLSSLEPPVIDMGKEENDRKRQMMIEAFEDLPKPKKILWRRIE